MICENAHKCKVSITRCTHKKYHDFYPDSCNIPCRGKNGIRNSKCISKLEYEMKRIIAKEEKKSWEESNVSL